MIGEEKQQSKKLPVDMYFKWKSFNEIKEIDKDGCEIKKKKWVNKFESYDKELQTTHQLTPDQFILLETGITISGWNATEKSFMYSNMIRNLKTEELTVRTQAKEGKEGKTLYQGIYDKDEMKTSCGSKYQFTSNAIVLENGILCNYQFVGGDLFRFNNDKKLINTSKYKIKYDGIEELTNGDVTYTVPKWIQGDIISDEEWKDINDKVEILKEYFSS